MCLIFKSTQKYAFQSSWTKTGFQTRRHSKKFVYLLRRPVIFETPYIKQKIKEISGDFSQFILLSNLSSLRLWKCFPRESHKNYGDISVSNCKKEIPDVFGFYDDWQFFTFVNPTWYYFFELSCTGIGTYS